MWRTSAYGSWDAWVGETDSIRLIVIPELGSKIVSLVDLRTGREWLAQSAVLGNRGYASAFSDGDLRGWDEMFPTIDECAYPAGPWQGTVVPDHGEVWSVPWRAKTTGRDLLCTVQGIRFPYRLEKRIVFDSATSFVIRYSAVNLSSSPFCFLWAAHPLLQVEPGMEMIVPYAEGREVELVVSKHDSLGAARSKLSWPLTAGPTGEIALHRVPPKGDRYEKYYFRDTLTEGWAELRRPATGESLRMAFPLEQVPYFAIWANFGGFHDGYHVAFEPATGTMDSLATAWRERKVRSIPAGGTYEWTLRTIVSAGVGEAKDTRS